MTRSNLRSPTVVATLALVAAIAALGVAVSRPDAAASAKLQLSIDELRMDAVDARDVDDLEARLSAAERDLQATQSTIAQLSELAGSGADATKVDAALSDLWATLDSIDNDLGDACARIADLEDSLGGGSYIAPPPGFGSSGC